jgi:ATP-binding cassette, subfamily D (ALD), peroxisomal long-chain fatty acid import protein
MIIFNYQLARSIGLVGMGGLSLNYITTAIIMRSITPAFGKLAAEEAKLEVIFELNKLVSL